MSTVRAPYPSEMEDIHGQSIISIEHPGSGIIYFRNRAGVIVAILETEYHPGHNVKAIRRIGSYHNDFRDVLIKDWYRPYTPTMKVQNPSNLPTAAASAIAWNPDGRYVAIGFAASPWFHVYKRSGNNLEIFDTKLANPTTLLTGPATGLGWSQDGRYLLAMSTGTQYAYYLDSSDVLNMQWGGSGFLTPTGPRSNPNKFRVTRDGYHMVILYTGSPWIDIFRKSVPQVGDYYRLTASVPTAANVLNDAAWTQDSKYLAICNTASSPYLSIYKRTGDTFANLSPTVPPLTQAASSVAFSLDDNFLAVGLSATPFLQIYQRDNDVFTKVSEVAAASGGYPTGQVNAVDWSPDGKYITVVHSNTPYYTVYKFELTYAYVLTKLQDPAASPGSDSNDVRFSPDGKYGAIAHISSPFLTIYRSTMGPISGPAERIDPNAPVIVKSTGIIP